ncbi:MAG: signal peptidase II [Anaerolineae bacterium]|nr:signal peptidase II [Anaerolineae bacterium]MDW8068934.1 signal peptidase II [Anaerolineae bacterium]
MSGLKNLILITIAALTVALDQATKSWIVAHMSLGESREVAPWLNAIFSLTYVTNTGIAFGLFQGLGDVLLIVALLAVGAMFIYYRHLPPGPLLLPIALGLQLGGALGNLIDRLTRGAVVDFIDLNFWPLHHWPIFNLADASIVTGVALLVLMILSKKDRREPLAPT